ncbi:MAG TPA: hypothetical protein VEW91_09580 [bacterium]|nr:hypothetical protein [bacterium]
MMALACGLTGITIPTRAADSFSFTTIDAPGATRTWASGINDAGQIVGSFNNHGYLRTSWGAFTTFDVPGATDTGAEGINNAGQIVGTFVAGDKNHGYVATPTR